MKNFSHPDTQRLALWSISQELASTDSSVFSDWCGANEDPEPWNPNRQKRDAKADAPFVTFILLDDENDLNLQASFRALAADRTAGIEIVIAAEAIRADAIAGLASSYDDIFQLKLIGHDEDQSPVEAEQRALSVATGKFIAFMSPGEQVAPTALDTMHRVFDSSPKLSIIYSDEDWIDEGGERKMPRFKTGWDPDAQLGFDLLGRLCLLRRSDVNKAGALRPEYAPAHHYDLHCRLTDEVSPSAIRHIPEILYHRLAPVNKSLVELKEARDLYSRVARLVAQEAASRSAVGNVVVRASDLASFINHVVWPIPAEPPLVSLVIPTRDKAELLRRCVDGILSDTAYAPLELLIVDNDSIAPETAELFDELAKDHRVRILRAPGAFNYSEINNHAAAQASGQVLLFLNNDVEVISSEWLREMVGLALRPDIGCVGAKLLYPNQKIQHAGVVLQEGPLAMHIFRLWKAHDAGYDGQLAGVRSYSVVTAACLAIRKELFDRSGGFDQENLKVSFSDVDLCLRIDEMGYRNLCTPFATLLHHESASRGADVTEEDIDRSKRELNFLASQWPDRFRLDNFNHPKLELSWDKPIRFVPGRPSACENVISR